MANKKIKTCEPKWHRPHWNPEINKWWCPECKILFYYPWEINKAEFDKMKLSEDTILLSMKTEQERQYKESLKIELDKTKKENKELIKNKNKQDKLISEISKKYDRLKDKKFNERIYNKNKISNIVNTNISHEEKVINPTSNKIKKKIEACKDIKL